VETFNKRKKIEKAHEIEKETNFPGVKALLKLASRWRKKTWAA